MSHLTKRIPGDIPKESSQQATTPSDQHASRNQLVRAFEVVSTPKREPFSAPSSVISTRHIPDTWKVKTSPGAPCRLTSQVRQLRSPGLDPQPYPQTAIAPNATAIAPQTLKLRAPVVAQQAPSQSVMSDKVCSTKSPYMVTSTWLLGPGLNQSERPAVERGQLKQTVQ